MPGNFHWMIQTLINVSMCNSWQAQQHSLTHTTGSQGLGGFFFETVNVNVYVPNIRMTVAAMASLQGVHISVLRNNGRLLYTLLTFNWYLRKEILTLGPSFECLGRIYCPRKWQRDCNRKEASSLSHPILDWLDWPIHSKYSQVYTSQQ